MAEFELTKSGMTDATNNMRNYIREFQEEAALTLKAAEVLAESWTGDASDKFHNSVLELNKWAQEMVTVANSYADSLAQAQDEYTEADTIAAKNFRK